MSAICPKCNGQGGHDPYCDFCGGSGEVESTQLDDSKNAGNELAEQIKNLLLWNKIQYTEKSITDDKLVEELTKYIDDKCAEAYKAAYMQASIDQINNPVGGRR